MKLTPTLLAQLRVRLQDQIWLVLRCVIVQNLESPVLDHLTVRKDGVAQLTLQLFPIVAKGVFGSLGLLLGF